MRKNRRDFTIIPNALLRNSQLSIQERYLYCILLRYCGQDEHCFPSQETLGIEVGLSARQVRTILKKLEGEGLITITRSGFNRSNTYYVSQDLETDRKGVSPHIRNIFPLQGGSPLPTTNTYLKGKDKNSIKGFESLRETVTRIKIGYGKTPP